jgi:hypothetical protein
VVSDINGVSAQRIIKALLEGDAGGNGRIGYRPPGKEEARDHIGFRWFF